MTLARLQEILAGFGRLHITVVGDLFLDRWWEVDRSLDEPSVETGLTAYQVTGRRQSAGAAGTVLNNLAALGVGDVQAVSMVGDDGEGFSIKPNWQENYKLAEALTAGLNERIPGICRDIMVKTGRYNQHMSERAVLIEVGHNENTLQEALNATEPLADVIADLLLDPASAFAS
mgnify:CR=1 FL=1